MLLATVPNRSWQSQSESPAKDNERLVEAVCGRENRLQALKRVKSNKGVRVSTA
jgi:hypothetical protein